MPGRGNKSSPHEVHRARKSPKLRQDAPDMRFMKSETLQFSLPVCLFMISGVAFPTESDAGRRGFCDQSDTLSDFRTPRRFGPRNRA
jgi:hypothetical protein